MNTNEHESHEGRRVQPALGEALLSFVSIRVHSRLCAVILAVLAWSGHLLCGADLSENVSFRNDVMAVLSKAGCNAGACHGNKNGKGGFKLSLRGQDPDLDYLTLSRDIFARRTNPLDADQSLVLLKPTTQVPHEGGLRFR